MGIDLNNDQIYAIYDLEHWWNTQNKQVFEISGAAGTGKAQPINTVIPTPKGNMKLGDLKVGDFVFNRHGKPVQVLGVYKQGLKRVFKVTFNDGRSTLCNDEHLWSYYLLESKELKTSTLKEMVGNKLKNSFGKYKYHIPYSNAVYYITKEYSKPTYKIGENIGITSGDILDSYKYGSELQRWHLIQGILDYIPDVIVENNSIVITNDNLELLQNMREILLSLGISAIIDISTKIFNDIEFFTNKLIIEVREDTKDRFFKNRTDLKSELKKIEFKSGIKHHTHYIVSVEDLEYDEEMCCIYVDDPEHLYLTNDFIVTHNTTLIRYFIDRLGLSYDNVLFVAFMGKAASQMSRNGLPAKTIHSAIYDYCEKYARDEEGKLILTGKGKPKKVSYFKLKERISKKIKLIVVDEASMVDKKTAVDLLSFGVPVICLGDLNQLPPVFGDPYFLNKPDVVLKQIMRQAEGDPIIYLAQCILNDKELKYGVYGNSAVIRKHDITDFQFRQADIILTGTNRLRFNINNYCRTELKKIKNLEYPNYGEKVICRKNNWDQCIDKNIYMTNGTTGFVDRIDKRSYNTNTMIMDFRPDFTKKSFKNIEFDLNHMYAIPGSENNKITPYGYTYDKMEFAYAITVHSSQGSQWDNVLYMHENFMRSVEDRKKLLYTAITRAAKSLTIVL